MNLRALGQKSLTHLLAFFALFVWGCARCSTPGLAELKTIEGVVERDFQQKPEAWQSARTGDVFALGDGLRTAKGARAELHLYPAGQALVAESTVLRFLNEKPKDGIEVMEVEEGVVEIDSAAVEIELRTGSSRTRIAKASRVRVRAETEDGAMLDVIVGRVKVERTSEKGDIVASSAEAGETIALEEKVLPEHKEESAPPDKEPTANSEKAAKSTGVPTSPPRDADVVFAKLERATLHAKAVPVNVALDVPGCTEGAAVDVAQGGKRRRENAVKGSSRVVITLGAGTHSLVTRCEERVVEAGSLRVLRDAGTLELPRTAPRVELAADGRRYTVRYQNVLPIVTVTWPNAPAGPYTLRITRADRRVITLTPASARAEIRSGELPEGEHQFVFSAGGKSSKATVMRIVFDNTARVGFVTAPLDGVASSGSIDVVGGSLLNAAVSVEGKPLVLDARGRFNAPITHSADASAIAVRISHPSTGVHYYIRRLDRSVR